MAAFAAGDEPQYVASFADRIDETMTLIRDLYPAISDPAPDNPYDRETQPNQHSYYFEVAQQRLLFDMDGSVKGSVLTGFREGKTLGEIIQSTQGLLTWEELPDVLNSRQMYHHRGIMDENMSDEEWQSEANKVVIFHTTHTMVDGSELHLLLNTYMATRKEMAREATKPYTILDASEKEPVFSELYIDKSGYRPGGQLHGEVWRPLGFLPGEPGDFPDILVSYGPRGMVLSFSVYLYAWNSEYAVWEGAGLWSAEGIGFFEYDSNTFEFSWGSESVNLRDMALKYEEELAESRSKSSTRLSPPEEEYVKRPEPQISPMAADPAAADSRANAAIDTGLPSESAPEKFFPDEEGNQFLWVVVVLLAAIVIGALAIVLRRLKPSVDVNDDNS